MGASPLDGPGQTLPALYGLPKSDFNDITDGSNRNKYRPGCCDATGGYDLVTGLGTPIADRLVNDLAMTSYYSAPSSSTDKFVLRQAGTNLDIFNNGALVAFQPVNFASTITIAGGLNASNSLTIDYSGGIFSTKVNYIGSSSGGDTMTVDDSSTTSHPASGPNAYVITDNAVYYRFAAINYSNLKSLTLLASASDNRIDVMDTAAKTAVTVKGGGGDDSFFVGDADGFYGINAPVAVIGNGGQDTMWVYDITAPNSSSSSETPTPSRPRPWAAIMRGRLPTAALGT